jgi:hypothetical protein
MNKKVLEEKYLGRTVIIVSMSGEPHYNNRSGKVVSVDDSGQLHGTWGGLALQPENDKFVIIGGR